VGGRVRAYAQQSHMEEVDFEEREIEIRRDGRRKIPRLYDAVAGTSQVPHHAARFRDHVRLREKEWLLLVRPFSAVSMLSHPQQIFGIAFAPRGNFRPHTRHEQIFNRGGSPRNFVLRSRCRQGV